MSQPRIRRPHGQKGNPFPRKLLFATGGLIAFVIAGIAFGQATDIGVVRAEIGAPAAIRDIRLAQADNGVVRVTDAVTGDELAAYNPGEAGFVSGSVRGLDRMRLVAQADRQAPYRLIRWSSGAVSLSDTATGERIYLNAFGPDNVADFARLLDVNPGENK